VFVTAFLVIHVASLVVDPKAGVDVPAAFIPGLSQYRSVPVALGTLALYAFLVTAITARWTKLLPSGVWLKLHRLSLLVFVMAWLHGILAGTDSTALEAAYVAMAVAVTSAGTYRYWAAKRVRPTFSTRRMEADA
jgi:DMSO/TMAO reductase YedYZ heme-binding membrane subunit